MTCALAADVRPAQSNSNTTARQRFMAFLPLAEGAASREARAGHVETPNVYNASREPGPGRETPPAVLPRSPSKTPRKTTAVPRLSPLNQFQCARVFGIVCADCQ